MGPNALRLFLRCASILAVAASSIATASTAAEKTLYERLGGEAAVRKVVDDFVATAAPDAAVDFTRGGTWQATPAAVAVLKQRLVEFMGQAFGGPLKYTGRDMKTVHAGMMITEAQFNAIAGHLEAALRKNGVSEADVSAVMKIAGSTASDIIEVR